jgi:hypothetical protein
VRLVLFPIALVLPHFVTRRRQHFMDFTEGELVDVVTLSLSGTRVDVPRDAADRLPRSYLYNVLRGTARPLPPQDALGAFTFARDPHRFLSVLDLLAAAEANTAHTCDEALAGEARYWGIRAKRSAGRPASFRFTPSQPSSASH